MNTLDRFLELIRDGIADAEYDALRRRLEAVDKLEAVARLAVKNEAKADSLRDSGMVDYPDIKALRGTASAARKVLACIDNTPTPADGVSP